MLYKFAILLLSKFQYEIKRINYLSQKQKYMKSPLLPKGSDFARTHENLVLRVQSIRKKNDQYQRLNAEQIDSAMAQQILQEKSIMDKEIEQTRRKIEDMETAYRQPMHKNKLKQTKRQYEKQLSRYKQVSQSLMQKSVIKAEMRNSSNKRDSLPNRNNRGSQEVFKQVRPDRGSAHLAQQQQLDVDYDFEHHVIMERKKQIGRAQQQAYRINAVMKDMSYQVNEQGQKVDIIGEQMLKAHQNVQAANEELVSAASQQKKGCKKCYIVLFVVIFLIIVLIGTFFILQKKSNSQ